MSQVIRCNGAGQHPLTIDMRRFKSYATHIRLADFIGKLQPVSAEVVQLIPEPEAVRSSNIDNPYPQGGTLLFIPNIFPRDLGIG